MIQEFVNSFNVFIALKEVQFVAHILGLIGMSTIVIAYYMIEQGQWHRNEKRYYFYNLTGAGLLELSLLVNFNLGSFIIEIFWMGISILGLLRIKKNQDQKEAMEKAITLSSDHMQQGDGGPFGAIIIKDGELIAEGWNTVTSTLDCTAHAEVNAIRKACEKLKNYDLSGCEIYTSCEPCPMCMSAIYWSRISKVYFANTKKDASDIEFDDQFIYDELKRPLEERKIPIVQVSHDEALQVFNKWREKSNKIKY